MLVQMLTQASILAILNLVVALVPLAMGLLFAVRPNEQRLALMRPLSLAAIFSAVSGTFLGLINVLQGAAAKHEPLSDLALLGLSEALVPIFFAFGCLTIAWLAVAFGMKRQT